MEDVVEMKVSPGKKVAEEIPEDRNTHQEKPTQEIIVEEVKTQPEKDV